MIYSIFQKKFTYLMLFGLFNININASYELTNNSNQNINNLVFYNNSHVALTTPISLLPSNSVVIPSNATYTVSQIFGSTITENVSDSASSDFFGTGSMINTTGTSLYINYYNEGTLINAPSIPFANGQKLPIFQGSNVVQIYSYNSMTEVAYFTINANTNYNVYYSNGRYNIQPTSATSYSLTNNYNQTITNLTFYNESSPISTAISLAPNSFINIPATSTSVIGSTFGATITEVIPVLSSVDFYAQGTFTNNTPASIFINFYNSANLAINSAPISVPPYVTMPIFTDTTSISTMTNLNPLVYAVPGSLINANNSYTLIENNEEYEVIEN